MPRQRPKAIQEWMALSREEREALVDAATPRRVDDPLEFAIPEYPDREREAEEKRPVRLFSYRDAPSSYRCASCNFRLKQRSASGLCGFCEWEARH